MNHNGYPVSPAEFAMICLDALLSCIPQIECLVWSTPAIENSEPNFRKGSIVLKNSLASMTRLRFSFLNESGAFTMMGGRRGHALIYPVLHETVV